MRHFLLSALGVFAVLAAGCGRKAEAPVDPKAPSTSALHSVHMGSLDPAVGLANQTPQDRAKTLREKITAPKEIKKIYVQAAQKYTNDPDPDVQAAAKELIQSAQ